MIERINVFYKGLGTEDGGGAGSYAFLVYHDDSLIHEESVFLEAEPAMSRFIAEYQSIGAAIQWLIKARKHPHHIRFNGDEALIVNHMNRRWKPKHQLFPICRQTQFLLAGLKDAYFNWIPVVSNKAVPPAIDQLLAHGIDAQAFLDAQEKMTREKIASGEYR